MSTFAEAREIAIEELKNKTVEELQSEIESLKIEIADLYDDIKSGSRGATEDYNDITYCEEQISRREEALSRKGVSLKK